MISRNDKFSNQQFTGIDALEIHPKTVWDLQDLREGLTRAINRASTPDGKWNVGSITLRDIFPNLLPDEPAPAFQLLELVKRAEALLTGAKFPAASVVVVVSTRKFRITMQEEIRRLNERGNIVLRNPWWLGDYDGDGENLSDNDPALKGYTKSAKQQLELKMQMLMMQSIEIADEVHVVDCLGYIGKQMANEINYALRLKKPVRWMNGPPPYMLDATTQLAQARNLGRGVGMGSR